MSNKNFLVVVDGPAGGGKTSLCKKVGNRLGLRLLDTGAIYRSFTLLYLKSDEDLEKASKEFFFEIDQDGNMKSNQGLVGDEIRSLEISENTSKLSALKETRNALLEVQRKLVKKGRWIAEGRDLASVVFPNADVKVYLDANSQVRSFRRYKQNLEKGEKFAENFKSLHKKLKNRDIRDFLRKDAPLIQINNADYLDTSALSILQVEDCLVNMIRRKMIFI